MPGISLKIRLGLGAVLLALGSISAAVVLYRGMTQVADRLETAVAAEQRMARYSTLSKQVSTFLVIATEAIQTNQAPETRMQRLQPVTNGILGTFEELRRDLEKAVAEAEHLGIDQQARYGTQSLGIARMEALLQAAQRGLLTPTTENSALRAYVDSFASGFDPLLSASVNAEVLFRAEILQSIEDLRHILTRTALIIALLSVVLVVAFYFGIIRPQFSRLSELRQAARQIGAEEFDLILPDTHDDEIGLLFAETRQTARRLAHRKSEVQAEWTRLNDTIAQRTQELRDANQQLEEIDSNRRRFFADVSHELRTPLTVILMEAQLGQKGGTEPNIAFSTIEARAKRLNRRIDDLLRVARSESGQLTLDPVSASLPELVKDICNEVSPELESANIELRCETFPETGILCDTNWFRQVVVGLIRNAIRHARVGGIVALQYSETETHAGLAVIDNGPGISLDQHEAVFDRFTQNSNNTEGFGVGLALSRWVVAELNGELELTSPTPNPLGENPGLQISVRMPRAGL